MGGSIRPAIPGHGCDKGHQRHGPGSGPSFERGTRDGKRPLFHLQYEAVSGKSWRGPLRANTLAPTYFRFSNYCRFGLFCHPALEQASAASFPDP